MRLNVSGFLTLRLPFSMPVHAPEHAPDVVITKRVLDKLGRSVEELLEAVGYDANDPNRAAAVDMLRQGMEGMTARVARREPGDPAECDCSQCRPCKHEPDPTTLRVCAPSWLEIQCKLCGEWGQREIDTSFAHFAIHEPSVVRKGIAAAKAEEPRPEVIEAAGKALCGEKAWAEATRIEGLSNLELDRALREDGYATPSSMLRENIELFHAIRSSARKGCLVWTRGASGVLKCTCGACFQVSGNVVMTVPARASSIAAMEQALRDAGVPELAAHVYGASEFVEGRATEPTWSAPTIKELARKAFNAIGDLEQTIAVALYVDGQWIGELPTHQWQADLCMAFGSAVHEWAGALKTEEAAFDAAVKEADTKQPKAQEPWDPDAGVLAPRDTTYQPDPEHEQGSIRRSRSS